jgi:hypothetical protein
MFGLMSNYLKSCFCSSGRIKDRTDDNVSPYTNAETGYGQYSSDSLFSLNENINNEAIETTVNLS